MSKATYPTGVYMNGDRPDNSLTEVDKHVEYKFKECDYIDELRSYIDSTYGQHYSKSSIETMEVIVDDGEGIPYCRGNILKYARRYGKKGDRKEQRKDLMKILHYAMYMLYLHDEEK